MFKKIREFVSIFRVREVVIVIGILCLSGSFVIPAILDANKKNTDVRIDIHNTANVKRVFIGNNYYYTVSTVDFNNKHYTVFNSCNGGLFAIEEQPKSLLAAQPSEQK